MEAMARQWVLGTESEQLRDLNERLESYLQRVAVLEKENCSLRNQIEALKPGLDRGKQKELEGLLAAVRQELAEGWREADHAVLQRDSLLEEMRRVSEECLREARVRSVAEMELDERQGWLEEEEKGREELESQVRRLQEELGQLEDAQREERGALLKELSTRTALCFRSTPAPAPTLSSRDLEHCLGEVGMRWTEARELYREELARVERAVSETSLQREVAKEESKDNRYRLQALRGELEGLKDKRRLLEEKLRQQSRAREQETQQLQTTVGELEKVKESLAAKMDQILEDQRHLMQMKLALSLEVATYRALLNSEADRMNFAAGYRDVQLGFPSGNGPSPLGRLGSGYPWRKPSTVTALGSSERRHVAASRGDKVAAAGSSEPAAGRTSRSGEVDAADGDLVIREAAVSVQKGAGAGVEPESDRGANVPSRDETVSREAGGESEVPETKLLSKPETQPPSAAGLTEHTKLNVDAPGELDIPRTRVDGKGIQLTPLLSTVAASGPAIALLTAAGFLGDSIPSAGQPQQPVEETSLREILGSAAVVSEKPRELVPEPRQQAASPGESPEPRKEVQGEGPRPEEAAAGAEEKKLDGDQKEEVTSAEDKLKSAGEVLGEVPAREEISETIESSEAPRTEQPIAEQVEVETAAQDVLPGGEVAPKTQEATVCGDDSGSGEVAVEEVSVGVREDEPRPREKPPSNSSQEQGGEVTGTEEPIAAQLIREDLKSQEPVTEKETAPLRTTAVQEGSPGERSSKLPGDSVQGQPDERIEEEVVLKSERKEDVSGEPCVVETAALSAKEMFLGDKEQSVSSTVDQHLSAGKFLGGVAAREEKSETIVTSEAPRTEQPVAEQGEVETEAQGTSAAEEESSPGDSVQEQPEEKGEEEVVLGTETKEDVSEDPCVEETAAVAAEERFDRDLEEEVTSTEDQHLPAEEVICEESAREEISETIVSSEAAPTEQPIAEQVEEETAAQDVLPGGEDAPKTQEATVRGDDSGSGEVAVEEVSVGVSEAEPSGEPGPQEELPSESSQEQGAEVTGTEESPSEEPVAAQPILDEPESQEPVSEKEAPPLGTSAAEDESSPGDSVQEQPEERGEEEVVVGTETKEDVSKEPCVEETAAVAAELPGDKEEEVTSTEEQHVSAGDESAREEISETIVSSEAARTEQPIAEQVEVEMEAQDVLPGGEDAPKTQEATVCGDDSGSGEVAVEEVSVGVSEAEPSGEPGPQEELPSESSQEQEGEVTGTEESPSEEPVAAQLIPEEPESQEPVTEKETVPLGTSAAEEASSPGDSVQEQPEEKGEEEVVLGTETKEDVSEDPCVEETAAVAAELPGDKEEEVTSTEEQHVSAGEESAREEISETIESSEAPRTEQPIEEQGEEETEAQGTSAVEEVSSPGDSVQEQPEERGEEEVVLGTETKEDVSEDPCVEETAAVAAELPGDKEEEVTSTEDQHLPAGEVPCEESAREEISETIVSSEAAPTEQPIAEQVEVEMEAQDVLPGGEDAPKTQEATVCGDDSGSGEVAVEEVSVGVSEAEPSGEPGPQEELPSESSQEQEGEVTGTEERPSEEPVAAQPIPDEPESQEPVTEKEAPPLGTSAAEEASSPGDSVQEQPEEKGEEEVVLGTETKEDVSEDPCVEETAAVAAELPRDKEEEVTSTEDQHLPAEEVICEESAREEISETIVSSEAAPTEQPIAEQVEEETEAQDVLPGGEDAPKTQEATVCGDDSGSGEVAVEEVSVGVSEAEPSGEPGPQEELPSESSQEQEGEVTGTEESPSEEPVAAQPILDEPESQEPVSEKEAPPLGTSAAEEASSPGDSVQEQPEERGEEEVVLGTETKEDVSEDPCVEETAAVAAEEKLPGDKEEEVTSAEDQHLPTGDESAREEISETIESSEAPLTEQPIEEQGEEETAAQDVLPGGEDAPKTQEATVCGDDSESGEVAVEEVSVGVSEAEPSGEPGPQEELPSECSQEQEGEVTGTEESPSEEPVAAQLIPEEPESQEPVTEKETAPLGTSAAEEASSPGDSVQEQPEERGEEEVVLGTETKEDVSEDPCVEETAAVPAEEKLPGDKEEEVTSTEDQHLPAGEESAREEISETIESSEAPLTEQPIEEQGEEETEAQGTSAVEEVSSPGDSVQEQPEGKGEEEVVLGTETKEDVSEGPCVEETAAVAAELPGDKEEEVTSTEDQHLSAGVVPCEESAREEILETIVRSVEGQEDQEEIPAEVVELETEELVSGQEGGSAGDMEEGLADEDLSLVKTAPLAQPELVEDEDKFGKDEADCGDTTPAGDGTVLASEEVPEPAEEAATSALPDGAEEQSSREDCLTSLDAPSLGEVLSQEGEAPRDSPVEAQPAVLPESPSSEGQSPQDADQSHTPPSPQTSEVQGDVSPCEEEHPNAKQSEDGLPGGSSEPGPRDEPVPEEGSDSDGAGPPAGGLTLEDGGLQTEVRVEPVNNSQTEEESPETPIAQQTGEEIHTTSEHEDSPKGVQTPSNLLQDQGDIPAGTPPESAWRGDSNGVEVAKQEGSPGEEEVEGRLVSSLEVSGPGMGGESLTEDQETSPLQGEADQSYKGQNEPCGPREESEEDSSIASPLNKIDSSVPDPSDANWCSDKEGAPCRGEELGTLREPTQICEGTVERATSPETHHHLETREDEKLPGEDSSPSVTEGTEEGGDGGSVDLTLSSLPPSPAQDTTPADVQDPCPVIPALPGDQQVNGLHDCCETLRKGEGRTVEMIATAYHYCSSEDE